MRVRFPFAILAVVAAFASGLASSHWVREAHAQSQTFGTTVYVPSDGLAFRTLDGRLIAKLSYDDGHGGAFQLYDERERPVVLARRSPQRSRRAVAACVLASAR